MRINHHGLRSSSRSTSQSSNGSGSINSSSDGSFDGPPAAYFAVFNRLITLPEPGRLKLNGRTRRPPLDPVNLCNLMEPEEDSIRFYNLGRNWQGHVEHFGCKEPYDPDGPLIV